MQQKPHSGGQSLLFIIIINEVWGKVQKCPTKNLLAGNGCYKCIKKSVKREERRGVRHLGGPSQ